ncbi:hypothetical protein ACVV4I_20520 [Escherichia coli]
MRGGDIQRAFIRPGVLSGDRFYGIDFRQNFTSDTNYFLSCWRYLRQVLAASGKI